MRKKFCMFIVISGTSSFYGMQTQEMQQPLLTQTHKASLPPITILYGNNELFPNWLGKGNKTTLPSFTKILHSLGLPNKKITKQKKRIIKRYYCNICKTGVGKSGLIKHTKSAFHAKEFKNLTEVQKNEMLLNALYTCNKCYVTLPNQIELFAHKCPKNNSENIYCNICNIEKPKCFLERHHLSISHVEKLKKTDVCAQDIYKQYQQLEQ